MAELKKFYFVSYYLGKPTVAVAKSTGDLIINESNLVFEIQLGNGVSTALGPIGWAVGRKKARKEASQMIWEYTEIQTVSVEKYMGMMPMVTLTDKEGNQHSFSGLFDADEAADLINGQIQKFNHSSSPLLEKQSAKAKPSVTEQKPGVQDVQALKTLVSSTVKSTADFAEKTGKSAMNTLNEKKDSVNIPQRRTLESLYQSAMNRFDQNSAADRVYAEPKAAEPRVENIRVTEPKVYNQTVENSYEETRGKIKEMTQPDTSDGRKNFYSANSVEENNRIKESNDVNSTPSGKRVCRYCGYNLAPDDLFCPECGSIEWIEK